MKLGLVMALVFGFLTLSAQEVKEKKRTGYDQGAPTLEIFSVLKSDGSKMHGSYVKYAFEYAPTPRQVANGKWKDIPYYILERGSYAQGEKKDAWEYYSIQYIYFTANTSSTPGIDSTRRFRGHHYQLLMRGSYVNGKKNGIWTEYHLMPPPDSILQKNIVWHVHKQKENEIPLPPPVVKSIGQYLNDKKIGEWTVFDHTGDLYQKYHASKRVLLFDKSIPDVIDLNRNREPVFLGGRQELYHYLTTSDVFWQRPASFNGDTTRTTITFVIEKDGTPSSISVLNPYNDHLQADFTDVLLKSTGQWLPAFQDGEPVASTQTLFMEYVKILTVLRRGNVHKEYVLQFRLQ